MLVVSRFTVAEGDGDQEGFTVAEGDGDQEDGVGSAGEGDRVGSAGSGQSEFVQRARIALEALAARPGFRRGRVGRSADEPTEWVLVTEWAGVGAYRRALSAYEVRLAATPLLAQARDEAGAFEVLLAADGPGAAVTAASDRAADAATAAPRPLEDR